MGARQRSSVAHAQAKQTLNPLHKMQLHAFITAAEAVDADSDTLDDLLDAIDEDFCGPTSDQGSVSGSSETGDSVSGHVHDVFNDTASGNSEDGGSKSIDAASELLTLEEEAAHAWTEDEVKEMMHFLKERGMDAFIMEYVFTRRIHVVKLLFAFDIFLCPELQAKSDKTLIYFLKVALSRVLRFREKLVRYNSIEDAVSLIQRSRRILILTGAGISVSCGIPDFRSRNGLYATLKERGEFDLDDPQQMFDIHYFKERPAVFYSFASRIYPSNFVPSPCHRFIKLIEDKGKLLRNYTQNIDTLETQAGIRRVLQCHGSFKTASCILCRKQVPGCEIELEILSGRVPQCQACFIRVESQKIKAKQKKETKKKGKKNEWEEDGDSDDELPVGVMKPDITFFGEKLSDKFDHALEADRDEVDLVLVIGTSLKVSPVSEILSHLPHSVPQILINKTPIKHINPDIVLLGDADEIVQYLCDRLHWTLPPPIPKPGHPEVSGSRNGGLKRSCTEMAGKAEPARVGRSHVWLFHGAEGGKWLEGIEEKYSASEQPVPPKSAEPGTKRPRVGS